jgi:hypothetical protein
MINNRLIDQDLIDLFTGLIQNNTESEILRIIFSDNNEEGVIEKLINYLELEDDQH